MKRIIRLILAAMMVAGLFYNTVPAQAESGIAWYSQSPNLEKLVYWEYTDTPGQADLVMIEKGITRTVLKKDVTFVGKAKWSPNSKKLLFVFAGGVEVVDVEKPNVITVYSNSYTSTSGKNTVYYNWVSAEWVTNDWLTGMFRVTGDGPTYYLLSGHDVTQKKAMIWYTTKLSAIGEVSISSNGAYISYWDKSANATIIITRDGKPQRYLWGTRWVGWSPDGRKVAGFTADSKIAIYDLVKGTTNISIPSKYFVSELPIKWYGDSLVWVKGVSLYILRGSLVDVYPRNDNGAGKIVDFYSISSGSEITFTACNGSTCHTGHTLPIQ